MADGRVIRVSERPVSTKFQIRAVEAPQVVDKSAKILDGMSDELPWKTTMARHDIACYRSTQTYRKEPQHVNSGRISEVLEEFITLF